MPTPFPGMDPYLEQSRIWRQVHSDLIVDIRRFLTPILRPYYTVDIEQRTYLAVFPPEDTGIPDVLVLDTYYPQGNVLVAAPTITFKHVMTELPTSTEDEFIERYLEIRHVNSQEVITAIEIISPTNKLEGKGRQEYLYKRNQVLNSLTNLVEIDLLRAGKPLPMKIPPQQQNHYRLVVSRSPQRPQADIYLFGVREAIPDIPIPLRPGEHEPLLPLNQLLHTMYDQGGYDLKINYRQPPEPPLTIEDAEWANQLLQ